MPLTLFALLKKYAILKKGLTWNNVMTGKYDFGSFSPQAFERFVQAIRVRCRGIPRAFC
jgi:hypothetical protein